jgi:hypothetical protein
MNIVLDISSVVWDRNKYNEDSSCFYDLANEVLLFVDSFDKLEVDLWIQQELLDEILVAFPFDITDNNAHYTEFRTNVFGFLSRVSNTVEHENIDLSIITNPDIFHTHFSDTMLVEYKYLIYKMHISENPIIFCTFSAIWNDGNLNTEYDTNTKEHETVIHQINPINSIELFLNSLKKQFEHNGKHDSSKGIHYDGQEIVYPLSCFDERKRDNTMPQDLLDRSVKYGKNFYVYDEVNNTYVCFKPHGNNCYHGHDEDIKNVPQKIRKQFKNE